MESVPPPAADDDDSELAPRPRPGFRSSRDRTAGGEKAHLFAAVMRAACGAAGLFAALLYLPIQNVTPVLAGISILMMVTGSTSAHRSVQNAPALQKVPFYVMGACALVTALTLVLTVVVGAGSLGPLHDLHTLKRAASPSGTVSFRPTP